MIYKWLCIKVNKTCYTFIHQKEGKSRTQKHWLKSWYSLVWDIYGTPTYGGVQLLWAYSFIRLFDFQELNKTSEPAVKTRRMNRKNLRKQIAGNVATYSRGE